MKFLHLTILLISVGAVTACASKPTPNVQWVEWTRIPAILETGDVQSAMQTHGNLVTLSIKNGRVINAKAPEIDALIRVINACNKCADGGLIVGSE